VLLLLQLLAMKLLPCVFVQITAPAPTAVDQADVVVIISIIWCINSSNSSWGAL
jgi:hypothetical protein